MDVEQDPSSCVFNRPVDLEWIGRKLVRRFSGQKIKTNKRMYTSVRDDLTMSPTKLTGSRVGSKRSCSGSTSIGDCRLPFQQSDHSELMTPQYSGPVSYHDKIKVSMTLADRLSLSHHHYVMPCDAFSFSFWNRSFIWWWRKFTVNDQRKRPRTIGGLEVRRRWKEYSYASSDLRTRVSSSILMAFFQNTIFLHWHCKVSKQLFQKILRSSLTIFRQIFWEPKRSLEMAFFHFFLSILFLERNFKRMGQLL